MNINKVVTGQGEDVVISHGWGCDHRYMQPIVDQLANRYRVTNIDLPGRGQSAWLSSTQSMEDLAEQLLPILPKQAIYIGWSFGGVIATAIAAKYHDRVKHFIGIATTPKFVASDNWPGIPAPGFKPAFEEVRQKGLNEILQAWFDGEFADFNPKPAAYHELTKLLSEIRPFDMNAFFRGIEIVDATDLRKEFASIQCPIDLIFGEKDGAIPIASTNYIKNLNSNVKIHIIPNAQHASFWTHPQEFNKILNNII